MTGCSDPTSDRLNPGQMIDIGQVWAGLRPYLLLMPAVLLIALLFVVPLGRSVELSFETGAGTFGLDWYARFWHSAYLGDLVFTLAIGLATALATSLLALPLAFLLRHPFRGRAAVNLVILVPLVVPHIIAGYALWLTMARSGPIFALLVDRLGLLPTAPQLAGHWSGILIALVWKFFPVATLTIASAMERIDPALEEAARDLGAGALRRLTEIVLPLLMPGLLSGAVLVFIMATAQFSITLVVYSGTQLSTIPLGIYYETFGMNHWAYGSALGVVLTVVTLVFLGITTQTVRRVYREAIAG